MTNMKSPHLLHGNETRFYGDSAYRGEEQRARLKQLAPQAKDFTNKRAYRNAPLTDADRMTNRRKSSVRSKVEHPFLTLKASLGLCQDPLSRPSQECPTGPSRCSP
jgi:IS5 family transposase